jgi:hypothetical protein
VVDLALALDSGLSCLDKSFHREQSGAGRGGFFESGTAGNRFIHNLKS